jgi:hypothetical protein
MNMDTIKPIESQLPNDVPAELGNESSMNETTPLQQEDKKEDLARKVDEINTKKSRP